LGRGVGIAAWGSDHEEYTEKEDQKPKKKQNPQTKLFYRGEKI